MKTYIARSFNEYIEIIKEIQNIEKNALWYRGHTKASYILAPSLYRDYYNIGLLPENVIDGEYNTRTVRFPQNLSQ